MLSQVSLDRPKFIIGDEVRYNDKDYTITNIDMSSNLKTVTIRDHEEFLGGMIRGSEVLIFRNEDDLERMFEPLGEETIEIADEGEHIDELETVQAEDIPEKTMLSLRKQEKLLHSLHQKDLIKISQLYKCYLMWKQKIEMQVKMNKKF